MSAPIRQRKAVALYHMVRELADVPSVAGVHIMAPGNDAAVPDIIKAARDSAPVSPAHGQLNADFTRSENGTRRMRTPVASKMALAMAAPLAGSRAHRHQWARCPMVDQTTFTSPGVQ